MQKLTAKEIVALLEESGISVSDWAYSGSHALKNVRLPNHKRLAEIREQLGQIDYVVQEGGEGQGDTWYAVNYFADHDVYLRTDGYYTSYNGTEFYDGFGSEVRPKEKTITVYESFEQV